MKIGGSDTHAILQERVEAERFRALLIKCDAYLEGHFVSSSSGLHFVKFFDMQRAFQFHQICDIFALHLYRRLPESIRQQATLLAGPERGAWPLLLTLAHYLPNRNVRTLSLQKSAGGGFELPKNAVIEENDQILIVDDVLTTGRTTRKVVYAFPDHPVIGAAFGVNRAPAAWDVKKYIPFPTVWVFRDPQEQFRQKGCPACLKGIEITSV